MPSEVIGELWDRIIFHAFELLDVPYVFRDRQRILEGLFRTQAIPDLHHPATTYPSEMDAYTQALSWPDNPQLRRVPYLSCPDRSFLSSFEQQARARGAVGVILRNERSLYIHRRHSSLAKIDVRLSALCLPHLVSS